MPDFQVFRLLMVIHLTFLLGGVGKAGGITCGPKAMMLLKINAHGGMIAKEKLSRLILERRLSSEPHIKLTGED